MHEDSAQIGNQVSLARMEVGLAGILTSIPFPSAVSFTALTGAPDKIHYRRNYTNLIASRPRPSPTPRFSFG